MNKDEVRKHLEAIYIDYYDGLVTRRLLHYALLRLQQKYGTIESSEWSELILDAQWKYADDKAYEQKIKQIAEDAVDAEIEEVLNNYNDVIWLSRTKVCKSNAGYYIGRMARVTYSDTEVPWQRDSEYFESEIEAFAALKLFRNR